MIGKFNFHKNCSIIHHLPQGLNDGGLPVIVFPRNSMSVVAGHTYEFDIRISSGTYVIDGKTYRVAHADILREVDGKEGNVMDQILYSHSTSQREKTKPKKTTLADLLDPATRAKLEALKSAL